MRVCVIGAGFAGLAAATALLDGGAKPIVLEARDRVGGRVWSQRLANGALIERGAEFVERDQSALLTTMERLGLRLAPAGMSYSYREPRGVPPISREALQAALDTAQEMRAARDKGSAGVSVARFLADAPIDPVAREVIAARVQVTCAHPTDDLSVRALDHISFAGHEGLRIAGGNQGVALGLAALLGDAVRLSCPVEAVAWSPDGVQVRAEGTTVSADACVIAAPASVLDRIRFDPPLPDWKADALSRVTYGHAAKLFVPLLHTPPHSSVLAVREHFWTWTARGADGAVQPVVSAFAGSAPALDLLGVSAGPARWLERVRALRPDLALDPDGVVLSTWSDDPWVRGAYSARTTASRPDDAELLARSVDCLHFAGEHTAGPWSGQMEGALRSGQRAAAEVLAARPA
jgi:monoamine oxidase